MIQSARIRIECDECGKTWQQPLPHDEKPDWIVPDGWIAFWKDGIIRVHFCSKECRETWEQTYGGES